MVGDGAPLGEPLALSLAETTVLVIAHDRPAYLRRCLEAMLRHHPAPGRVLPIVVSEDRGGSPAARRGCVPPLASGILPACHVAAAMV